MKNMTSTKRLTGWIAGIALAVLTPSLFAHTGLEASVPAANAHLDVSPAELRLTFGSAVRLMKISVLDEQGKEQPLDFKPSAQPAKDFSVALPKLPSSTYTVHWVSLGGDGHKMSGDFSFMVGAAGHNAMAQPADDHHAGQHNH